MIETYEGANSKCSKYGIPIHMWDAVSAYVVDHRPCGSFFMALVENNLLNAVSHADDYNRTCLVNWVDLMYNEFPASSWGNPEKVKRWLNESED